MGRSGARGRGAPGSPARSWPEPLATKGAALPRRRPHGRGDRAYSEPSLAMSEEHGPRRTRAAGTEQHRGGSPDRRSAGGLRDRRRRPPDRPTLRATRHGGPTREQLGRCRARCRRVGRGPRDGRRARPRRSAGPGSGRPRIDGGDDPDLARRSRGRLQRFASTASAPARPSRTRSPQRCCSAVRSMAALRSVGPRRRWATPKRRRSCSGRPALSTSDPGDHRAAARAAFWTGDRRPPRRGDRRGQSAAGSGALADRGDDRHPERRTRCAGRATRSDAADRYGEAARAGGLSTCRSSWPSARSRRPTSCRPSRPMQAEAPADEARTILDGLGATSLIARLDGELSRRARSSSVLGARRRRLEPI